MTSGTALVVGASGIAGHNAARRLLDAGWTVQGVTRHGTGLPAGTHPVTVDITDAAATRDVLADLPITHLFYCTWSRQPDEAANCAVNTAMLGNVLQALEGNRGLVHSALVTGLKHYLGPFEAYAQTPMETPFREEQPRLPYQNFYYDQEDLLIAAAARQGFTWSVHRPHTMIGWALGNAMNMGVTLAAYGTLCRHTGQPFTFPGSPQQYAGVTDISDARLVARQLEWAATTPGAANQAFNCVNGGVFRWRQVWPVLAGGLGVPAAPYPGHPDPLEPRMADAQPIWDEITAKYGLPARKLDELASWWHTDGDLGRQVETFADMTRSRRLGFLDYQDSAASFLDLFAELRRQRIIPPLPSP
jgi:nucleoside-diphosphate-sugar epimerase